jgi:hypothetical protein
VVLLFNDDAVAQTTYWVSQLEQLLEPCLWSSQSYGSNTAQCRTQPALSVSDTKNCCQLGNPQHVFSVLFYGVLYEKILVSISHRQLGPPAPALWVNPLWLLNYEHRRGLAWPNLMYYPAVCLEGLRKPAKASRTIGVTAEIRTKQRPKSCHDRYRLNHRGRWLTIVLGPSQDRRQEIQSISEPQSWRQQRGEGK